MICLLFVILGNNPRLFIDLIFVTYIYNKNWQREKVNQSPITKYIYRPMLLIIRNYSGNPTSLVCGWANR